MGSNVFLDYPDTTVCLLFFLFLKLFSNSSPPVTPSILIRSCCGLLFLWHLCNGQFDRNVHLTREDIAFFPNITSPQHMKVRIEKSKTHSGKKTITIASSQSNICAVATTRDFLLQTPASSLQSPMFQFKDGTPLSRRTLASKLHTLLDLCGLQSSNYNTHSFRIGAAMTAAAAGLPSWRIKILRRWRSDSYERYNHLPQTTILQVPTTVEPVLSGHPRGMTK